jgi:hypothetical protein
LIISCQIDFAKLLHNDFAGLKQSFQIRNFKTESHILHPGITADKAKKRITGINDLKLCQLFFGGKAEPVSSFA